ncbi:MAG: methyltransferase domain-containing protein [Anaerolineae bacterium]|nr:methyltransferase domain-containing protein [Anaerolineae bacterium]
MAMQDIFQAIGSLDAAGVKRIVDRLEYRGKDETFVEMREEYLRQMNLPSEASILDLGCGTGVVTRALAAREGFSGSVTGIDYSPELISAAKRLAEEEGVADRVEFRVGDAQSVEDEDESYDAVILHTVVSHVPDPGAVVSEAARILKPGGSVAIFDGDYASLTYAATDHEFDAEMVQALLSNIVANPYIMRELPTILRTSGLQLTSFYSNVLAEVGVGQFFSSLAESYVPIIVRAQLISEEKAEDWLNGVRQASSNKNIFASCNYYTYIAQRPETL